MKKKLALMSIAGILVLTAIIGGTLAGFSTKSEQGRTDIITKDLSITLEDGAVPLASSVEEAKIGMPGDEVEMPYHIVNDIADGYELYTRVTIYKYWENKDEELDSEMIQLYALSGGEKVELLPGARVNGWWVWYADEEQVIAYYTEPLSAGEATANILDMLYVKPEITNKYTGETVMLEIEADAVQKAAADAAIPSEWGVYPTFDADGNITNIEE